MSIFSYPEIWTLRSVVDTRRVPGAGAVASDADGGEAAQLRACSGTAVSVGHPLAETKRQHQPSQATVVHETRPLRQTKIYRH